LQLLGAARRQLAAQERFDFARLRIEEFRQDLGIVTLSGEPGFQPVNILGEDIIEQRDCIDFSYCGFVAFIETALRATVILSMTSASIAKPWRSMIQFGS
jgi:hypothetical protein